MIKNTCLYLSQGLLAAILFLELPSLQGDDWPRWRGAALNGISPETNWSYRWPGSGPRVAWKSSLGIGFSSFAISQGAVYTMGNSNETDTVFCFDAASGEIRWKHSYPQPLLPKYYEGGPLSTPTLDEDRVYTMSKQGLAFCLDSRNGRVIWSRNLPEAVGAIPNEWGLAGSPLVQNHLVIYNAGSAGTALEKRTGEIAWKSAPETTGYASPLPCLVDGTQATILFAAKHLLGVDSRSGRILWRYPWETGYDNNNADPVIRGSNLFISSYSRGCALLELRGGRLAEVYVNKNLFNHMSPPVLLGDYLYAFNGREGRPSDFRCLHYASGEVQWSHKGLGVGSLISAGGKLIILSETGELIVAEASPKSFTPLAQAEILKGRCWTPPVLANGFLYARNAKGDMVCLDLRKTE